MSQEHQHKTLYSKYERSGNKEYTLTYHRKWLFQKGCVVRPTINEWNPMKLKSFSTATEKDAYRMGKGPYQIYVWEKIKI